MIEIKPTLEIMEKIFSNENVKTVSFTVENPEKINKLIKELNGYNIAWELSEDKITFLIIEDDK